MIVLIFGRVIYTFMYIFLLTITSNSENKKQNKTGMNSLITNTVETLRVFAKQQSYPPPPITHLHTHTKQKKIKKMQNNQ